MLEARTFVDTLDNARQILVERNAILRGEYEIHNSIYASKDKTLGLDQIFLRLRTIPKNIWDEKPVVLAIKKTELKEVGKNSVIPFKRQYDTKEEALQYVQENFLDTFEHSFDFSSIGWQYDLGEDQVDLENIEGLFSIEFKSKTEQGLKKLLKEFGITDTIKGPSVVAVKKLLQR